MIAIMFVSFRIWARIKGFKRLYWDDFLVLVAVILHIVTGIVWQTFMAHDMYETMNVLTGLQLPEPNFLAHGHRYAKSSLASLLLFYSTLWAIKFSFLIFFRRLGRHVRRQRLLWWPIFGFTVTSYLIILGVTPYRCLKGSIPYLVEECASESVLKYNRTIFLCCFIFDVSTDIASKSSFFFFSLFFFFFFSLFLLIVSKLRSVFSHADTCPHAMESSNETFKKTSPCWYFLTCNNYYYFCYNPCNRFHNFDKHKRSLLDIFVDRYRSFRR